jgi:hypothetical protein
MKILTVIAIVSLFAWLSTRIYANIKFGIDCDGHLKRAADANSIELATQELTVVITYLEQHQMTTGYTSIFYNEPDEDVGFWYTNLKVSLQGLEREPPTAAELEKSNILLKLRQTLLDVSASSESVTEPSGISIFPRNVQYAYWAWGSLVAFIVFLIAAGKLS